MTATREIIAARSEQDTQDAASAEALKAETANVTVQPAAMAAGCPTRT